MILSQSLLNVNSRVISIIKEMKWYGMVLSEPIPVSVSVHLNVIQLYYYYYLFIKPPEMEKHIYN